VIFDVRMGSRADTADRRPRVDAWLGTWAAIGTSRSS
jgi:hypothetical protein